MNAGTSKNAAPATRSSQNAGRVRWRQSNCITPQPHRHYSTGQNVCSKRMRFAYIASASVGAESAAGSISGFLGAAYGQAYLDLPASNPKATVVWRHNLNQTSYCLAWIQGHLRLCFDAQKSSLGMMEPVQFAYVVPVRKRWHFVGVIGDFNATIFAACFDQECGIFLRT